ncbi:Beta-galactosidase [Botrimarina colliarenosi]|uniref:Beta-galactosidase n=1 Tax=Botrimarina colliarenosi TaxID=2528001 RepID=A0A5C6ABM9_9BACT|nr:glycoside hydrolase family 2 TIM barrel-domain containing protein [Botrimarina colliarenosi]TWT96846.1 Beta-galactosidase [Botrimarina colliarenosi]
MLVSLLAALSVAAAVPVLPAPNDAEPRRVVSFDEAWSFHQGDVQGAAESAFDASDWSVVTTPHDWAIAGPFRKDAPAGGEGAFLPTGVAWYRKAFVAPESLRGRRLVVDFDGVMANSRVYLNGELLGERPNGYVSFRYDLTPHLRYGDAGPNVLAVRTDTSEQVASRWYTGSGVYRHVRLVELDPLHVAYNGVGVTTPEITPDRARVAIEVTIRNDGDTPRKYTVLADCLSPSGEVVGSATVSGQAAADGESQARLTIDVASPELWDFDKPQLYTARIAIESEGNRVDQVTAPFGVRTAEFRSDSGFWLNGRHHKLRGVCLHHDGGAVGAAVPLAVWRDRLATLQALGVNAIRTSHNPVAPEFLDLCDAMGIVVMSEFFDCWEGRKRKHDYGKHFAEWWRRDLTDTLRRDRNHPSIVLYSVGNEIRDTHQTEKAKRILAGLVEVCHEVDPTRPVTQGLFRPNVTHDYDNGLADLLDVIGTNYRDAELLQAWRDNPDRKIIGTEQPHERQNWLLCRDNPPHAGQFLWVGVDYLGESRSWPITTFDSGLIDRTGALHPRGAERQSWWSERPVVSLYRREAATEATPADPGYEAVEWRRREVLFPDWTPRDATADEVHEEANEVHEENVEVYSNCEEVELLLNGRSLGAKPLPTNAAPRNWAVRYEPGALVAVGRNGGQEVARCRLDTAGAPVAVRVTTSRDRLSTDWDEVAMVRAEVVDAAGVRCPRATNLIQFTIEGPGQIVATDNGSIVDLDPFTSDERHAYRGRALAVVRATAPGDALRVTASAEGLQQGSVSIASELDR